MSTGVTHSFSEKAQGCWLRRAFLRAYCRLRGAEAHLQACMCTVSSSGQRSSRQRSSAALFTSSTLSSGSASARLLIPDSPSRSVRKPV